MKNLITIISSIIFIVFISACQFDPYADELTTVQPRKEDVVGAYQFKEQTVSESTAISKLGKNATIILKSNGTYQATDIPNVVGGSGAENHEYITAKGTWEIERIGSVDNGWGHLKPSWGLILTGIDENFKTIGFTGRNAPYGLIINFDDPDLGAVMLFKKIK